MTKKKMMNGERENDWNERFNHGENFTTSLIYIPLLKFLFTNFLTLQNFETIF